MMAGVWVFKNGLIGWAAKPAGVGKQKTLVYAPTGEVMTSHGLLEEKLKEVGWVRVPSDVPSMVRYKKETYHMYLPRNFNDLLLMHMYYVVVCTRNVFQVRDLADAASSP